MILDGERPGVASPVNQCLPVLSGVRVEAIQEVVTLTATDRYRLTTRTGVPSAPATAALLAPFSADLPGGTVET